jgi:hypothetical protein
MTGPHIPSSPHHVSLIIIKVLYEAMNHGRLGLGIDCLLSQTVQLVHPRVGPAFGHEL